MGKLPLLALFHRFSFVVASDGYFFAITHDISFPSPMQSPFSTQYLLRLSALR